MMRLQTLLQIICLPLPNNVIPSRSGQLAVLDTPKHHSYKIQLLRSQYINHEKLVLFDFFVVWHF